MPMLGFGGYSKKKPDDDDGDESTVVVEDDLSEQIAAFCDLGYDYLVAMVLAWDGVSPSALREFLRKHPGCDLLTAAEILR